MIRHIETINPYSVLLSPKRALDNAVGKKIPNIVIQNTITVRLGSAELRSNFGLSFDS